MTDREKAEEALLKAGYVWVPARCEYVRNEGLAHIDVWWCGDEFQMRGFAEDLPSLLFPTLTPEKVDEVLREALSLWFAKRQSIELKDDNMFRNFVIARLRDVVSPTLTLEECEALEFFADGAHAAYGANEPLVKQFESTLRLILARFGGDTHGNI